MRRLTMSCLLPLLLALLGIAGTASAASTSAIPLQLPAGSAFSVLGHSCGGIQQQVQATGFDPTTGFPTGVVYLQTRCGGSGRGGGYHTTTYAAWLQVSWDFTGATLGYSVLSGSPAGLNPALLATDAAGNQIANSLVAINVLPPACAPTNTTYCRYTAALTLAPGFVPQPRVTALSVTSGPASGGTTVTLTGTGFTGATQVSFGAVDASSITVNSDTLLTAVSPAETAGTVDVTVTSPGGTSVPTPNDQFTLVATPSVTGLTPSRGSILGGSTVTITGVGLSGATGVSFGGTPAGFTVNDDTSITAVSPVAEAAETVDVTVTSVGGTSPTNSADRFAYLHRLLPRVRCGGLTGTVTGSATLSKCKPISATNTSASSASLDGPWTWASSAESTTINWNSSTSPGRGGCAVGSTETDLTGTVVDGTSTYTAIADPARARVCTDPAGNLSLVPFTRFLL